MRAPLVSKSDIGVRLRKLRRQADITQRQLADRLGIDPTVVCKWERGIRSIKVEEFLAICKAVGVDPDFLFICKELGVDPDLVALAIYNELGAESAATP